MAKIWDFSSVGWQSGIKTFFISLGKFLAAVILAAVLKQSLLEINYVAAHLSTSSAHYELFLALTALVRSLISGVGDWLTIYSAHNPDPIIPVDNASGLPIA
jgi:hypothetical protein